MVKSSRNTGNPAINIWIHPVGSQFHSWMGILNQQNMSASWDFLHQPPTKIPTKTRRSSTEFPMLCSWSIFDQPVWLRTIMGFPNASIYFKGYGFGRIHLPGWYCWVSPQCCCCRSCHSHHSHRGTGTPRLCRFHDFFFANNHYLKMFAYLTLVAEKWASIAFNNSRKMRVKNQYPWHPLRVTLFFGEEILLPHYRLAISLILSEIESVKIFTEDVDV